MNDLSLLQFLVLGLVLPFVLFTGLSVIARGKKSALTWSTEHWHSIRTNLATALTNSLLAGVCGIAISLFQRGFEALSLPHFATDTWSDIPFPMVLVVYLLAYDFCIYWLHRALHGNTLWPVHAVHHSDTVMNFTTSYRVHFLEPVLMAFATILGMSWLGLPPNAGVALALFLLLHNQFSHLDLDIHFGSLNRVFASPRFHRWHHADTPEVYNCNFANVFSFWDVLFGTYHCPGRYSGPIGYEGSPPQNFVTLVALPFTLWAGRFETASLNAHRQTDTA